MKNIIKEAIPYWYNREVYNSETGREDVKVKNLPKDVRDRFKPKQHQNSAGPELLTKADKKKADELLKDPEKLKQKYTDLMENKAVSDYLKKNTDDKTRKKLNGYDQLYSHTKKIHSEGRQPTNSEKVRSEAIKVVHDIDNDTSKKIVNKVR